MLDEDIRREVQKYDPGSKNVPKKKIDGLVGTKKRSGGLFFEEDLKTAAKSIYEDTVVPTIKDSAASIIIGWVEGIGGIFVDLIERMIYGSDARGSRRGGGYHRASYEGYYDRRKRSGRSYREPDREKERKLEYDEIIMETRPQCKALLMELEDDIDRYGKVTIADLYEHSGKTGGTFTDQYYGWRDLSGAFIKEVPEGFWLRLPKPIQLD